LLDGAVDFLEAVLGKDAVMAEVLDLQETTIGGKADLAQLPQIVQSLADAEVPGVVDGG
jgi:hypothetical protein